MLEGIIKIYTDGGARGNPGLAASAFIVISKGKVVHKESIFLGKKTNNEAEYSAVFLATKWLAINDLSRLESVEFFLDSELVVRQLRGEYKIISENLKTLYVELKKLLLKINKSISFNYVRREKNKLADKLVNLELDKIGQLE